MRTKLDIYVFMPNVSKMICLTLLFFLWFEIRREIIQDLPSPLSDFIVWEFLFQLFVLFCLCVCTVVAEFVSVYF